MNQAPVEIRLRPSLDLAPADAWFVPGHECGPLLDALCSAPALLPRLAKLSLLATPDGWIVLDESGSIPKPTKRALPLARHGRLLYPTSARLEPVPRTGERLSDQWTWLLLDPYRQAIGYAEDDTCRLTDLLDSRTRTDTTWQQARPGEAPPATLRSVEADPESLEQQRASALGEPPRPLDELAGESERSKGGDAKSAGATSGPTSNWLKLGFARLVHWYYDRAPTAGSGEPTWLDRLAARTAGWLGQQQQQGLGLRKFLEMLQSDPEQALRYAPPLAGDGAHRGTTPFDGLFPHGLDFSLPGLRSAGMAAGLGVDGDVYSSLQARYRELAEQALRDGDYRRAAYIFAHLLFDMRRAAESLQGGAYYIEAAVLYRDELSDFRSASRCFEDAGLFAEAAACSERAGETVEAGRLWRLAGDEERAVERFRAAIDRSLEHGKHDEAGDIASDHLDDPALAITMWRTGYREGNSRDSCADRLTDILCDDSYSTQRSEFLRDLSKAPRTQRSRAARTAAGLVSKARKDRASADWIDDAEDRARVLAAAELKTEEPADRAALLASLARMRTEDSAHAADCKRIAERRPEQQAPPPPPRVQRIALRHRRYLRAPVPVGTKPLAGVLHGDHVYLNFEAWHPSEADSVGRHQQLFASRRSSFHDKWHWHGVRLRPEGERSDFPRLLHLDLEAREERAFWIRQSRRVEPDGASDPFVAIRLKAGGIDSRFSRDDAFGLCTARDLRTLALSTEHGALVVRHLDSAQNLDQQTRHEHEPGHVETWMLEAIEARRARHFASRGETILFVIDDLHERRGALVILRPEQPTHLLRFEAEHGFNARFAADPRYVWMQADATLSQLDVTTLEIRASGSLEGLQGRDMNEGRLVIGSHPAGLLVASTRNLALYGVHEDRIRLTEICSYRDDNGIPLDVGGSSDWRRVRVLTDETLLEFGLD